MEEQFFSELLALKILAIRVIPNAKKTTVVEKMENGMWKIRVAAPPEEGRANVELLKFLKKSTGYLVQIVQGEKDRRKIISIAK